MSVLNALDVALKEWDATIRALASGRQIMLLRKGGIHETEGVFETEHRDFVFYPTFIHQHLDWIKPVDRTEYAASLAARGLAASGVEDPPCVTFTTVGRVTDVLQVGTRGQIDGLARRHLWLSPLLDMRFDYKPHHPLYVLLVRALVLTAPVTVAQTPAYAGCRSWVPLDRAIDTTSARPALGDECYAAERDAVISALR